MTRLPLLCRPFSSQRSSSVRAFQSRFSVRNIGNTITMPQTMLRTSRFKKSDIVSRNPSPDGYFWRNARRSSQSEAFLVHRPQEHRKPQCIAICLCSVLPSPLLLENIVHVGVCHRINALVNRRHRRGDTLPVLCALQLHLARDLSGDDI